MRSLKFCGLWAEEKLMNYIDEIKQHWQQRMMEASGLPWMQNLSTGNVQICHYKGFLQETYHNAGLNPQLQAFASMYIPGRPRDLVKKFYQHAISEIAHDVLALNDLAALGEDKERIINSKPLPITSAFYANTVWGIQQHGILYYLGYLFHLEFTPTQNGRRYIEMLMSKGVPESATTFLEEHATVDLAHNRLMEIYVKELVNSEKDLAIVLDSLTCSVDLHTKIIGDAFMNGERLFMSRAA